MGQCRAKVGRCPLSSTQPGQSELGWTMDQFNEGVCNGNGRSDQDGNICKCMHWDERVSCLYLVIKGGHL